ncbi:MAG TPA: PKD domain-containing protein [Thermoplasmatales archaeon]|nr:PKD domain-containing protein [Thermoplasmatales archaeon]
MNSMAVRVPRLGVLVAVMLVTASLVGTGFSFSSPPRTGETVNVTYSFSPPEVDTVQVGPHRYHVVTLPGAGYAAAAGEPCLPVTGAYILLPPSSRVRGITVIPSPRQEMDDGYQVLPAGQVQPLSRPRPSALVRGPVYQSSDATPGSLHTVVGTYQLRGYTVLVLQLHPVQYVPASGALSYYPRLTVRVDTAPASPPATFRGLPADAEVVNSRVDNPSLLARYPPPAAAASSDLLILTTSGLEPAFARLRDYHQEHGLATALVTIEGIGDTPGAIRSYIREQYLQQGIQYVLLGGDEHLVPAATLWVFGLDEDQPDRPYSDYMPSDLYYACLDGTFNGDGDDKWGEPTDGEDGGDVDLMAEVYVGRACVDDLEEAHHFVDKSIAYLSQEPHSYLRQVLLAGEYMGDYGIATWGGNYMDQLMGNCTDDGYSTTGIPGDVLSIATLYDRDQPWSGEDMTAAINDGFHIVNHLGHSAYNYALKMGWESVMELNNEQYCFIYSQGCMAGGFDQDDCMAEHLTAKTGNGAFATIMNARYGWFWAYSTDGDSQRYHRQFWDAVFGEDITSIGAAHQDSKEDNLFLLNRSCMRWCYYQLNLFGDPSIHFRINNRPYTPEPPTGEGRGRKGQSYAYTAVTTDMEGDDVYYQWDWGDGSQSDWLGPYSSGEPCTLNHTWTDTGVYAITVRARDEAGSVSEWSDPLRVTMPRPWARGQPFEFLWSLVPAWLQPLLEELLW